MARFMAKALQKTHIEQGLQNVFVDTDSAISLIPDGKLNDAWFKAFLAVCETRPNEILNSVYEPYQGYKQKAIFEKFFFSLYLPKAKKSYIKIYTESMPTIFKFFDQSFDYSD